MAVEEIISFRQSYIKIRASINSVAFYVLLIDIAGNIVIFLCFTQPVEKIIQFRQKFNPDSDPFFPEIH